MSTFTTPAPISATVDIIFGNITVKASDRTDTVVEIRPADPEWELDVKAAEQVVVEFTDGRLQVKHPKLRSIFSKRYGAIEVLIELPTGSQLHGYTAKGEYVVEGEIGSCELKTANGDIRLGEAAPGAVEARTAFGKIDVGIRAGVAAWLDLDTGFGRVNNELADSERPDPGEETVEVRARTSYGDIGIRRAPAA